MSQFEENKKTVFARKLKNLMKNWEEANGKKLSQKELASHVHASRETVNGWLTGKNYPSKAAVDDLCKFFSVPLTYFAPDMEDLIFLSPEQHMELSSDCEQEARKIGLDSGFVSFIKNCPELADLIVSASWIDDLQSFEKNVPENPGGSVFQFVSSTGVKIYLPDEVLHMLRLVQRDLREYARFLIEKWSKMIETAHNEEKDAGEITGFFVSNRTKSGKEITSAKQRFDLELSGRGSLTPGASALVNWYQALTGNEQENLLTVAHDAYTSSRNRKIRKAIETDKP